MPLTLPRLSGLSRTGRIAAQAAVLSVVVGGSVLYTNLNKVVTLSVDGQPREVSAFAGTVGDLLEDQGVQVSDRDLVIPSESSPIADGAEVTVRYARPFTVVTDGRSRTYWTTELTVDAALRSAGLRADGAKLSASRSAPIGRRGLALSLSTPKSVTLVVAGRPQTLTTTSTTVAQLLDERDLTVRPADRLSVAAGQVLKTGMRVQLTRVDERLETVTERVAAPTTTRKDSSLAKGRTTVEQAGRDGSRKVVYKLQLLDGKVAKRTAVSSDVVTAPKTRVVRVGTKVASSSSSSRSSGSSSFSGGSVGGVDGLNWAALAQCESGGNPRAVNPSGRYFGLYQFSVATWRSVGGSGLPSQASAAEQTYRAKLLYKRAGRGQWPHCGKRL